jgi:diaminopimelate decarboxylase
MTEPFDLKRLRQIPTPFYYYDLRLLGKTLKVAFDAASRYNYRLHYALKANANDEILEMISSHGYGADCVSGNEVQKAVDAGFAPGKIVFAGVGKSDYEIKLAIANDIYCFNVESLAEMEVINGIAEQLRKKVNIALRINPNIKANTHHYITTGLEENKFGINMWEMEEVTGSLDRLTSLNLMGLHFHIGSQITDHNVFKGLCLRVNEILQWFDQHHILIKHINLGGGLGVDYEHPDQNLVPDFESYFRIFHDFLEIKPGQEVHFEPGRALVAQCGTLFSTVLYVKKGINTSFAIIDAGMTELLRPALYQAYHKIENISSVASDLDRYDVVGPICESSDCFGKAVMLPVTARGDLIAIRTTGAYGETMASQYNLRDRVKGYYSL